MAIPFFKEMRIGGYLLKQKLLGRKRYPLVLMLEPLFRCNLACVGCGKIDYPDAILNRRMTAQECWDAADECGALEHLECDLVTSYLNDRPVPTGVRSRCSNPATARRSRSEWLSA